MNYSAQVIQALAGDDYTVYVYFSDGSVRLFDAKPLIEKGGVFSQLANETTFKDTLTVIGHAVAWDIDGTRNPSTCIDIDPASTYEQSKPVDDPLGRIA